MRRFGTRALAALLAGAALGVGACGGDDGRRGRLGHRRGDRPRGRRWPRRSPRPRTRAGTSRSARARTTAAATRTPSSASTRRYAGQGLKAELVEFPERLRRAAPAGRSSASRRSRSQCDVYQADVIWTAEFASQKWIMDITTTWSRAPTSSSRPRSRRSSTTAATGASRRSPARASSTGARIRSGTRRRPGRSSTRRPARATASPTRAPQYEGLTCDFLEIAFAAGGGALSEDGKKANFDTPENLKALEFMVGGMKDGAALKAVSTYMEQAALQAFQAGDATFMRNWSYAYALNKRSTEVQATASRSRRCRPSRAAGAAASSAATGRSCRRTRRTRRARCCSSTTSRPRRRSSATWPKFSLPRCSRRPTRRPRSRRRSRTRPSSSRRRAGQAAPGLARLPQISQAIYKNVNKALAGQLSPEEALAQGQEEIDEGAGELLVVELLIVGAGSRGATFADWARRHPGEARVVAVAEPRPTAARGSPTRTAMPEERRFGDWREAVAAGRVADAAVIATLDREHTEPALAFARQGYALLIEKPLAPTEAECRRIVDAVQTRGQRRRRRPRAALHALHAAAQAARRRRGDRRDRRRSTHLEPVGFWHQAHSFVRGNWRREDETGPMLLAKCCHDLDWLGYVVGRRCTAVSSFGGLSALPRRPAARRRRRALPGLRDRAGCAYSARAALPRDGRARRDRLAGRRGRAAADAGERRRGRCADGPVRPLRVGVRQRRRRPPGGQPRATSAARPRRSR